MRGYKIINPDAKLLHTLFFDSYFFKLSMYIIIFNNFKKVISSLCSLFNVFVSISIQSYGNSSLHVPVLYSYKLNNRKLSYFNVILHHFCVKKFFPWKFNLEYGGTFTKLFMHVSSRNMFPTIRNLQIRVHVYRPRHCCGDWLTFGCFAPMIADHDLVTKR